MTTEAAAFMDYEITDAETYSTMLRGAEVEVSQLEPGPLRGYHLRVGLPGGEISWIATNLPLRSRGHFPSGMWALTVVTGTASRSLQHGMEVRTGTQFLHRPGADQDGVYGRDFSLVCLCVRDEVFIETLRGEFPELSDLMGRPWRVSEPSGAKRDELIARFEEAAVVLRTDAAVRRSSAAKSEMQDELLAIFFEALADGVAQSPMQAVSNAAALVRLAEEYAGSMGSIPSCVRDLCIGCGVPRRTLSHAFHQVLGMGPATYLRRLRLNQVRRLLRQTPAENRLATVTEVALEHGFWHLGRFSSQYRELFGESPNESLRRSDSR